MSWRDVQISSPLARQLMQFSHPQQSQMAQLLGITIFIPARGRMQANAPIDLP
jgi:hypothetical protein